MNIIYSFNKSGFEAEYWQREIRNASDDLYTFVPFNHGLYLNPNLYIRAQLLDNLYYEKNSSLLKMYSDFEEIIRSYQAVAVIVDNCNPYHPDYLRNILVYKILRIGDGPMAAYDRDFAYLHSFDQVLYHSPAYSRDMTMPEKLRYCGKTNIDFWPLASFDALCDRSKTEANILTHKRDIDIIFVGALHFNKMPILAKIKRNFRSRFKMYGVANWKKNIFYNINYRFSGWVRQIPFEAYIPLYQRSKIGINIHNRGLYTVGGYRLFDLPANGVMQISDGGEYLASFFRVGEEVEVSDSAEEFIEKIEYYLHHDKEREDIAMRGFRRVQKEYTINMMMKKVGQLIERGMQRVGWKA